MAPKKSIADHLRARLAPTRGHPEAGGDDEHEEFNPPLNQQGASDFDKIVGTPARKEKDSASGSALAASTRATPNPQDDFILQQSAQQEQLKQMFLLVSSLGSKIEAVAEVVAESGSSNRRVEPPHSGPSHQEKGKAASRSVSFAKEIDEKEDENDDDEDRGIDSGDDYVSHGLYRDIIAEGFDKRSPSRLASLCTSERSTRRARRAR